MLHYRKTSLVLAVLGVFALNTEAARATIVVTDNNNAAALAAAVTAGNSGIIVTSSSFVGASAPGMGMNSGIYTTTAPGNTYGLENFGTGSGIVLSTGQAAQMGTAPAFISAHTTSYGIGATAFQNSLLNPITGVFPHFDVAELHVKFDMMPGISQVFFSLVFASAEWPTFVGTQFNDGFGLYLNGVAPANNIAFTSPGQPVDINNPLMTTSPANTSVLQGVMRNPAGPGFILTFSGNVNPTNNELIFIVGDSGDSAYDTTVWISGLGAQNLAAPEPATLTLAAIGGVVVGLGWMRRRKAVAA